MRVGEKEDLVREKMNYERSIERPKGGDRGRSSSGGQGNQKCQRCYKSGHWTFECKNEAVYVSRPSQTKLLKRPRFVFRSDVAPPPETQSFVSSFSLLPPLSPVFSFVLVLTSLLLWVDVDVDVQGVVGHQTELEGV